MNLASEGIDMSGAVLLCGMDTRAFNDQQATSEPEMFINGHGGDRLIQRRKSEFHNIKPLGTMFDSFMSDLASAWFDSPSSLQHERGQFTFVDGELVRIQSDPRATSTTSPPDNHRLKGAKAD